jgi:DNA-binding IclR family transcriptional regulator
MENIRSLELLTYIAASARPVTLREIAEATARSRSSTLRILDKLVAHGWLIAIGHPRRYRASMRVVELGMTALRTNSARDEVVPYLFQAVQDLELCSLNFYEAGECIVTDVVRKFGGTYKHLLPGNRVPAAASAAGKVILAHRTADEVAAVLATGLPQYTELTRTSLSDIRTDIDDARRRGFGVNRGEYVAASPGIAAPIFDAKGIAIAAIGARVRFPYQEDAELERRLHIILQASEAASLHLGHMPVSIAHVT